MELPIEYHKYRLSVLAELANKYGLAPPGMEYVVTFNEDCGKKEQKGFREPQNEK